MGPTLTLGNPEGGGGAPHRLPQTSPAPPPAKVPESPPQSPPPAWGLRRFPCQPSNSTESVASLAPVGAPLSTSPPPSSASSPQNLGGHGPPPAPRVFLSLLLIFLSAPSPLATEDAPANCPLSDASASGFSPVAPGPRVVRPNPGPCRSFSIGPHIPGGDPDSKAAEMINSRKHFILFS